VDGRDPPEGSVVSLFKGDFAGESLSAPLHLDVTATLRISLSNEITFHGN
jgi:hypothetical protein